MWKRSALIAIMVAALATVAWAEDATLEALAELVGTWSSVQTSSGQLPAFVVTFSADGTYRAVCRDASFAGASTSTPVEEGTWAAEGGVVTIRIKNSTAPTSATRVNQDLLIPYRIKEDRSVEFSNADQLTFSWTSAETVRMVQNIASVQASTWRAVKELFR